MIYFRIYTSSIDLFLQIEARWRISKMDLGERIAVYFGDQSMLGAGPYEPYVSLMIQ